MVKKNACIFISGKGSNLENLIKKSRDYSFPVNIKLVISNNKIAQGINFARINSIPFLIINTKKRGFENLILKIIKKNKISLICLAGYMKIISEKFIREFGKQIINIHPSLLPKYKGLDTYNKILKNKEKKTGCTIHFVNKQLDGGKIINKKFFFLNKNESLETLKIKTQKLERLAYPEAIIKLYRDR